MKRICRLHSFTPLMLGLAHLITHVGQSPDLGARYPWRQVSLNKGIVLSQCARGPRMVCTRLKLSTVITRKNGPGSASLRNLKGPHALNQLSPTSRNIRAECGHEDPYVGI